MIQKVELYNVVCDKCLDYLYNEDDTIMCLDEECLAKQVAKESGWVFKDGYLYCPSCAEKLKMSKDKYCGNCKHFKNESIDGKGWCEEQSWVTECSKVCKCHEFGTTGWTEITPDNVKELYKVLDRVVIAHIIPNTVVKNVVAYEKSNELYRSLEIIAELGGYYYYVLPELKIDGTK